MNDAEQIATSLDKCRRNGPGNFIACCPAHDDKNPSLSITDGVDMVLLYCFAGCSQNDVIEALRAKGLWPETNKKQSEEVYFTRQDLLEMEFYSAIADKEAEQRPLTSKENQKLQSYRRVLEAKR